MRRARRGAAGDHVRLARAWGVSVEEIQSVVIGSEVHFAGEVSVEDIQSGIGSEVHFAGWCFGVVGSQVLSEWR